MRRALATPQYQPDELSLTLRLPHSHPGTCAPPRHIVCPSTHIQTIITDFFRYETLQINIVTLTDVEITVIIVVLN